MRAAIWSEPNVAEATDKVMPPVAPGHAQVAPAYAGICGTDLHIWEGHHPRAAPGLTLGHEFVGYLATATDDLCAGAPVFVNPLLRCGVCRPCTAQLDSVCDKTRLIGIDTDGGAAERVTVPIPNLVGLPDTQDMRSYALVEPLAVCVRAVRRARQQLGDTVRVVGAGPIGLMVALCAKRAGASQLVVSEVNPVRAAKAQELGLTTLSEPDTRQYDVVYDCTGHPSVAPEILTTVRTGGTFVDVGLYREPAVIDMPSLMRRELTIVGTHVYRPVDVNAAIDLITAQAVPVTALISNVYPLDEVQRAFESVAAGNQIKALLAIDAQL